MGESNLHAEKVAKSLPLKQDYARARRLYAARLRLGGEEGYFRKKMAELEAVWKERGAPYNSISKTCTSSFSGVGRRHRLPQQPLRLKLTGIWAHTSANS